MAARTINVELLKPSRAKQDAFLHLQREVARLAGQWQQAAAPLAFASTASLEFSGLADSATEFALRRLAQAERAMLGLPDPWRSTLRDFLRRQAREIRRARRAGLSLLSGGRAPSDRPADIASHSDRPERPETMPVVFGAEAWQLVNTDGRWKLIIPLAGRTIAIPIAVPLGQIALLERLMIHGLPLEGRLYQRRGRWFFAARYLNDAPRPRPDAPSIGVDLGLTHRAVATEPASGRRLFLSGRKERARAARYRRLIGELRRAGARQAARRLEAKLERFRLQRDRETAIAVIKFAGAFDRPVIKFEKFEGSTPRPDTHAVGQGDADARKASQANRSVPESYVRICEVRPDEADAPPDRLQARFNRVIRMTARRAEPAGIAVVAVDGRYSSTTCAACGKTGERRGSSFVCACGQHAHADLNAARNLSLTAIWQETLQIAPAGYKPDRQADGTAGSATRNRYKDGSGASGSASAHAASSKNRILATNSSKEESKMASIVKDLGDNASKFVVGTLDNVKSYVDKTSEELSKVDVVGVTRHIFDTALDGAKNVVKTAGEPGGLDTFGVLKAFADGSLEATLEVVNVIAEEGKKADVFGMSTRIALEGLNALRTEVDLSLDTSKTLFNRLAPLATSAKPVTTRPPQVTRVEIDHDKPAAKSSNKSAS